MKRIYVDQDIWTCGDLAAASGMSWTTQVDGQLAVSVHDERATDEGTIEPITAAHSLTRDEAASLRDWLSARLAEPAV